MPQRAAYVPKRLLAHPDVWGRHPHPELIAPKSLDEAARIAVTSIQARLAYELRRLLRRHANTQAALALTLGQSPDHLGRKLAGAVPAPPEDLVIWAWLVDDSALMCAPALADIAAPSSLPAWPLKEP